MELLSLDLDLTALSQTGQQIGKGQLWVFRECACGIKTNYRNGGSCGSFAVENLHALAGLQRIGGQRSVIASGAGEAAYFLRKCLQCSYDGRCVGGQGHAVETPGWALSLLLACTAAGS